MLVELGNVAPKMADGSPADLDGAPAVTRLVIPDTYSFNPDVDIEDFARHLSWALRVNSGITRRPDDEALLALLHPSGPWDRHSFRTPSWVADDGDGRFAELVARYHAIDAPDDQPPVAVGRPDDVELTHWTRFGPPGQGEPVAVDPAGDLQALLVNSGRDIWARNLLGGAVGAAGTSTGATSTSLSDTGQTWTVNQWAGMRVYSASGVWANIISNTATALTLDRWYNPATPGGAAGTTPGATVGYIISDGGAPAWFVGLGNTNTSPVSTDTSMSGEITSAGGGLIRKIAPFAHSAGTNTATLTPVYTANGSDTLPVTIFRIGVFVSLVSTWTSGGMAFETLLSASATLSASGDQLTVTETVTGT